MSRYRPHNFKTQWSGRTQTFWKTVNNSSVIPHNNLPLIEIKIADENHLALLDSGSAISLISEGLFNKIRDKIKVKYVSRRVKIQSFTRDTVSFSKCIMINLTVGNKLCKTMLYVTNNMETTKYHILLGFDFLYQQKAIVNMDEMKLKLQNIETQLINDNHEKEVKKSTKQKKHNVAKLINKISIEPEEAQIVELKYDQEIGEGSQVFISDIKINLKDCLSEAISIVNNSRIKVLIHNQTNKKLVFNKDMAVAKVNTIFEISQNVSNDAKDTTIKPINNITLRSKEEILQLRKRELKEDDFDLRHVNNEEKIKITKFLMDNYEVFSKTYKTLGCTEVIKPELKLQHNFGIQCKPYPTPKNLVSILQQEIDELLSSDLIEHSTSEYAFPVIMVRKPSSNPENPPKYRMAIDFRLLNQITELYKVHIPKIKDITQKVAGFNFYTVVDLKAAFFQILIPEKMRKFCSFITEFGNFQIKRLAFGLKNSGAYFTQLMNTVMQGLSKQNIFFYLDDIILAADTKNELQKNMQVLFDRLKYYNLTLDPAKLQLFKKEITFLGFKINRDGIQPADKNVTKINQFPQPKTVKQVRSFLGMANYFRHLIENYAEVVEPLVNLTRNKVKFNWSEEVDKSFKEIQAKILHRPRLNKPDMSQPFYLNTDGSSVAICGILTQKINGEFEPIEYFSRKLKPAETRYHSLKLELMAIYESIKHFNDYLYGQHFVLLSDAKALQYHLKLEKQSDVTTRWLLELSKYDFTFKHIEGQQNPADFLSRQVFNLTTQKDLTTDLFAERTELTIRNIKSEQLNDPQLKSIISKIKSGKPCYHGKGKKFIIDNSSQLLMLRIRTKKSKRHIKTDKIVVPTKLQRVIIKLAHAVHFGIHRTLSIIRDKYFWKGMIGDVQNYIKSCDECLTYKNKYITPAPLEHFSDITFPMQQLAIDAVGPLPRTSNGNMYILTIVDMYTRFFVATPVRSITANTVLDTLKKLYANFGLPVSILSDNGSIFKNKVYQDFHKALGVEIKFTSPYKPNCNGRLEIIHKSLKSAMATICKQTFQWDQSVPWFALYHNNTTHSATGYTPAFLFFLRDVKTPFDTMDCTEGQMQKKNINLTTSSSYETYLKEHLKFFSQIRQDVLDNQNKTEKAHDRYFKRSQARQFSIGDLVFLKNFKKLPALQPKFTGPYRIIKLLRHNNVLLADVNNPENRIINIHINSVVKAEHRRKHLTESNKDCTKSQTKHPYTLRNNR